MGFFHLVSHIGRTLGVGLGFLFKRLRGTLMRREGPETDPILLDGWDLPPHDRPPRDASDS